MDDIVDKIACGDTAAAAFIRLVVEIAHAWDDLVDHDAHVTDERINRMMWRALIELPLNTFYNTHFVTLHTLMAQAIVNWQTANDMERGNGDLEVAYILRSSFVDIMGVVALLCGGREHALAMAPEIRKATHYEGLGGYRENLAIERTRREGA